MCVSPGLRSRCACFQGKGMEFTMRAIHCALQRSIDHLVLANAWNAGKALRDDLRLPVIIITCEVGERDLGIGEGTGKVRLKCFAIHRHVNCTLVQQTFPGSYRRPGSDLHLLCEFCRSMHHPGSARPKTQRGFLMISRLPVLVFVLSFAACQGAHTPDAGFSRDGVLETVRILSADDMQGRASGTEGSRKARAYLRTRLEALKLAPAGSAYEMPFVFTRMRDDGTSEEIHGANLVARIDGKTPGNGPVMVVSAHYDHLGIIDGEIYNGADDNASGVAGLLAVAQSFQAVPPEHDIVFALFDAEETGGHGVLTFLAESPVPLDRIALDLNLDMLSKNDHNELYAAGAYHYPFLANYLTELAGKVAVTLTMGHDDPALGEDDWTMQSDHGEFHMAGIPFVYFGVEDHPEYHKPSDDFETIPQDFFLVAVDTVVMAAHLFDENLDAINEKAGPE